MLCICCKSLSCCFKTWYKVADKANPGIFVVLVVDNRPGDVIFRVGKTRESSEEHELLELAC